MQWGDTTAGQQRGTGAFIAEIRGSGMKRCRGGEEAVLAWWEDKTAGRQRGTGEMLRGGGM